MVVDQKFKKSLKISNYFTYISANIFARCHFDGGGGSKWSSLGWGSSVSYFFFFLSKNFCCRRRAPSLSCNVNSILGVL